MAALCKRPITRWLTDPEGKRAEPLNGAQPVPARSNTERSATGTPSIVVPAASLHTCRRQCGIPDLLLALVLVPGRHASPLVLNGDSDYMESDMSIPNNYCNKRLRSAVPPHPAFPPYGKRSLNLFIIFPFYSHPSHSGRHCQQSCASTHPRHRGSAARFARAHREAR